MEEEHPTYHIYLLTVWQERPNAYSPQWRFRLVDPQTGFDRGFVTPQALPFALQQLWSYRQSTERPE
jgi:hypothetical protein